MTATIMTFSCNWQC